ncbi:GNVR domain-containing protein [Candidatus Omnitrophota bacterium]
MQEEFTKYRSPLEYVRVIFRRKWCFITPIFLGLVFSIVACFMLPPTYESGTVILVEEEKIINPLIQGLAVSTSVAQRMRTIKEQILSWRSLVELTKKLELAKDVKNQLQYEGLIKSLRDNIVVSLRGSNLIKLSYFGGDPERTHLIAKTLTDIFVEENMRSQTKETDVAIDFINEQLQVYKKKIKQTEIAAMEEQLEGLLIDSTEEHPIVKELRGKMDVANAELESGEFQVESDAQAIAGPLVETIKKELDKAISGGNQKSSSSLAYAFEGDEKNDDPNKALYKLYLMDKLDDVSARDMNVNSNIYNMLLQKLEQAKITQRLEASKEGTRYTILDPPRLPLKPVKPNKMMVMVMGLFLGGVSGTGLVFAREFTDESFLDIEDAKQNLDLPILGAISRLTTQEEIDKEKFYKFRNITIVLILSVVLIVAAAFVSVVGR